MDKATSQDKVNICIVNSPIYGGNDAIFLDKDIRTFEPICDEVFIITGNFANKYSNKVHIIEVESGKSRKEGQVVFRRIIHHFITQVKLAISLIKVSRNFDIVFFDIGEYRNLLPILVSKLLGKETVIFHRGGDKIREAKLGCSSGWERIILPPIEASLLKVSYFVADYILCESPSIIKVGKLERYRRKIIIWGGYYIDANRLQMRVPPTERRNLVGYSGRLSPVKGLPNLVRAVALVLEHRQDIKVIIAGSGEEHTRIENEIEALRALRVKDVVSLRPWIPDEEFPDFLGQIKVFVLPSYEEGIPSVIREAMACGTIVLATPVGGIPDIIRDGETGFILEDNTPDCIARNIIRALDSPYLDKIAEDGRALVERESTFEVTIERWRDILEKIKPGKIS